MLAYFSLSITTLPLIFLIYTTGYGAHMIGAIAALAKIDVLPFKSKNASMVIYMLIAIGSGMCSLAFASVFFTEDGWFMWLLPGILLIAGGFGVKCCYSFMS
jgi:hypothetical protein